MLVRLRIPGGQTTAAVLVALTELSRSYGAGGGSIQLTSRGNVQLRGLDGDRLPELTDRVAALGLLPSLAHERVRNIVASPFTGLAPGRPDVSSLVRDLDRALCADPAVAELPGRFLFAIDDGSGDVSSVHFDLAYVATGEQGGRVVLGGQPARGRAVARSTAVPMIIALARDFLRARTADHPSPWRVWEVPGLRPDLVDIELPVGPLAAPLGPVMGAASVAVPLGFLTADQAGAVDRVSAGGPVVITPWRGLVIPGAAGALPTLARSGLVVDQDSPWSKISACVGAPGCARSMINTREVAYGLAARPVDQPTHVSGCERRCGAPAGDHVDLVAVPQP